MAVNPSPFGPKPQFFDQSGAPDLGYKMFFYVAGSTSTKQDTYTDSTGSVPNTNPILLNALGQTPNELWFTEGLIYKVVLAPSTDTDPPTNPVWTIDNLSGQNDGSGPSNSNEWVLYDSAPSYVNPTTFTITGNQTDIFQVGRRIRAVNDGGVISYGTIISSVYGAVTTVTLANTFGALDSGLSSVSYGILAPINSSVPATYGTIVNLQAQTNIAFLTSGSDTAYTLAPTPALTASAENQRFQVEIHASNSTSSPTLSISGLPAKPIRFYDFSGNEVAPLVGQLGAGQKFDVVDAGANYVVIGGYQNIPIRVRQAIQFGPATGSPLVSDLIPQSQIGRTLVQGAILKCSTSPTLFSVANGFNLDGSPLNLNWLATADITVPNLTASSTNYIWVDTVSKIAGFVIVADGDQNGGTIPVTNNRYTFDYGSYKMYLGNGTTAAQSNRIIVAEVDTNATAIVAIRCAAYMAEYLSAQTALPAAATPQTYSHNIRSSPEMIDWGYTAVCTAAIGGFSVGDRSQSLFSYGASGQSSDIKNAISRSTSQIIANSNSGYSINNRSTGSQQGVTSANFATIQFLKRRY